jgi:hypothetical protein
VVVGGCAWTLCPCSPFSLTTGTIKAASDTPKHVDFDRQDTMSHPGNSDSQGGGCKMDREKPHRSSGMKFLKP